MSIMQSSEEKPMYFIPSLDYFNKSTNETTEISEKIKLRNYKQKNDNFINEYSIVSYKKECLVTNTSFNDTLQHGPIIKDCDGECYLGNLRSVIFNENQELVSFTPPKSVNYNDFTSNYPLNYENIVVEQFIEGTMISLFYNHAYKENDDETGKWEIATKSFVGANNHFFKVDGNPMSFKEMFYDIWNKKNLKFDDLFSRDTCYTFVIQHPENRIVTKIFKPCIFLVGAYKIVSVMDEPNDKFIGWKVYEQNIYSLKKISENFNFAYGDVFTSQIECPNEAHTEYSPDSPIRIFEPSSLNRDCNYVFYLPRRNCKYLQPYNGIGLVDYLGNQLAINDYNSLHSYFTTGLSPIVMGVIVKNLITGDRTKIRNPFFEYLRELRGNQPKLEYHYLELRKNGKLTEYLNYFPEYSSKMYGYQQKIHTYTNNLYKLYVSCYIQKEKPLREYSPDFRTHMFNIHKLYKEQLQPQGKTIQKFNVIQYVNDLPERLLMYCLNLKHRKNENLENPETVFQSEPLQV